MKATDTQVESFHSHPASIHRAPIEEVLHQRDVFIGSQDGDFLDLMPTPFLALNSDRQVVFANKAFKEYLGGKEDSDIIAQRPGEVLHCVYSHGEHGCGTAEQCRECGTLRAIIGSQKGHDMKTECQVLYRARTVDAKDLRMNTHRRVLGEIPFTFVFLEDIGANKRKENLERIFYHDALNAASGIYNAAILLETGNAPKEILPAIRDRAEMLIHDIQRHRALQMAENGQLEVFPVLTSATDLLESLLSQLEGLARKHKVVLVMQRPGSLGLTTDRELLFRVMENFVKNAIEASEPDATVTFGAEKMDSRVRFWVRSPGFIPKNVQHQIFKRSFSTKGKGRGLGTFSAKLFTENYLGGEVGFESSDNTGTVFWAELPNLTSLGQ